jgi:hypothetical protein
MRSLLILSIALAITIPSVAQENGMSTDQAARILAQVSVWPQPSYISPEQAATIFHFDGKLTVAESAQLGDTDNVSHLLIRPVDGSFDHISLAIGKAGTLVDKIQTMAQMWISSNAGERNPFSAVRFPNGATGYYDGNGVLAMKSADGRFDTIIEVVLFDDRGSPVVTASNKNLVEALTKSDDHGLKFLTEVMTRIAPLVEKKYREQTKIREQIIQASEFLKKHSSTAVTPPARTSKTSSRPVATDLPVDRRTLKNE